jgi:hypothetical protein
VGGYGGPPPVPAGFGHIFQKWINVTTKPGAESFAAELPTANWGDIWISVLLLGVVSAITGFIGASIFHTGVQSYLNSLSPQQQAQLGPIMTSMRNSSTGTSLGNVIFVPLFFVIWTGILFLFAKMFGGTGTFLQQSYARALYLVPLGLVVAVLGLVPILGSLASAVLGIYGIVLNVFSVSASQRLSGGKATAVVLLPLAIGLVLLCGLFVLLVAVLVNLSHGLTT